MNWAVFALILSTSVLAIPAFAQEPESSTPGSGAQDSIVVSGIKETKDDIDNFATAISQSISSSPMALYREGDFCARVVGLSEQQNQAIAQRMTQVAAAAGVEPGGADCQTSALVMFDDDRDELLREFKALHPEYFTEISGEAIHFRGEGEDVMAWKLLARLDRDGKPVAVDPETGIQIVAVHTGLTRLESATRPVVAMSVLLIETTAVQGLTTQQIADYALMRSLTEAEPKQMKRSRIATILRVVDAQQGEETPLSLTDWDFAYIKSRYALNHWNYGPSQMAAIRSGMLEVLMDTANP